MNTNNNTVLITGGSAGIGLAVAKQLSEEGNKIIITGRDALKLEAASKEINNVTVIQADVSSVEDVDKLVTTLRRDHSTLNLVINNAGKAFAYEFDKETDIYAKAKEEMETNYFSIIRLNEQLLPMLKAQQQSAIVNVSSIVAIVPGRLTATYSASKAALHSYSLSLRKSLEGSTVKVFELMPPLVNTSFSKEIGGENGITPQAVAAQLLQSLKDDVYEIHVGATADIYKLYLSSPAAALAAIYNR